MIASLKELLTRRLIGSRKPPEIVQIGGARSAGGGDTFWAKITDYEVQVDSSLLYSWERVDNDEVTGEDAIDLYDGRLALIDQVVLMTKCRDGERRFMWREPFRAEMTTCDSSDTAYVKDPTDATRTVVVERIAGFYEEGDIVLVVPANTTGSAYTKKWTIADRIPMVLKTPLDLSETEGDAGDDPAEVQDEPSNDGCEAEV